MFKALLKNKKRLLLYLLVLLAFVLTGLELLSRLTCANIYKMIGEYPCHNLLVKYVLEPTGNVRLDYPEEKKVMFRNINTQEFLDRIPKRTIYVPMKEVRANGIACAGYAFVAEELPPRAKKYVAIHENIHLEGERDETRTNYLAARMEPLGFVSTIINSLWIGFKSIPLSKYPCSLGALWYVFKLYFLGFSPSSVLD